MTIREFLLGLELDAAAPLLARSPKLRPLSPTEMLTFLAKAFPSREEYPVIERLDGSVEIAPWGIMSVVHPRTVRPDPEYGPEVRGTAGMARAIAKVDGSLFALPIRKEWMLVTKADEDPVTLLSVGFWLVSRQRVFEAFAADQEEEVRIPWVLAHTIVPGPGERVQ